MNLTFTSDFWTKKLTFDKGATVFANEKGIQVGNDLWFSGEDKPLLIADHLVKGKKQHSRVIVNFNGRTLFIRCVSREFLVNFEDKYRMLN